ncbi:MAG: TetR/AcrR family transcriptional regulator [Chromatiales bacterium]|nr:TetR/AcrR family transcriptional regulator [Chromatiales bacterium]
MKVSHAILTKNASSARERLLLTAHRLFYQHGIRATGIDKIIAEAQVTKVTFYRHFPSKNSLIREYLDYRHALWMSWFTDALSRHGEDLNALVPAMAEWFGQEDFRGCAFINSLSELGSEFPDIVEKTRLHKNDMATAIQQLLEPGEERKKLAEAIALIVDGAIVRAQYESNPGNTLQAMQHAITALVGNSC